VVVEVGLAVGQVLASTVQLAVTEITASTGTDKFGPAQPYFDALAAHIATLGSSPQRANLAMAIAPDPRKDYVPPSPAVFGLTVSGGASETPITVS